MEEKGNMTGKNVTDTAVPPLVGDLPPHCRRDVDTLRRFVHEAISRESPAGAVSPSDFKEVFLTGATGFVGGFVLRDLLAQNEDLVVHCIVRARNTEHGFDRLRAALRQADIWDEGYASRIRIVAGDVTEARFGLSEPDFEAMCQRIDAVYHLAADINLASSYLDIRKNNTFSIRNVLELCLRKRFKHLFYASTMGVFPQYFCAFTNEFERSRIDHQVQPDLESMKRMLPIGLLGYPWSKLVCEQTLLFAHAAGLPVGIFRLPRTCVASTGPTQANDITIRLLAAVADVELMPQGFSIQGANEAVDVLSQVLTAISMNPNRRFTIYHCCDSQPAFHEIEPADFGMYWPEVPYTTFRRACQTRGEKSPLFGHWALVDHFASYWFGDRQAGAALPICERAIREDCPNPIKWPSLLTLSKRSSAWIGRQKQWPHPVPESRLDFDCLMTRAEYQAERVGVPFGSAYPGWMLSGLKHLVQALKSPDARVLKDKLGDVVFELSRFLRNNAELARERRQHPEIEREEIARPVFIVGINRTGTTYLHRLMSRDGRFRALRLYEYAEPVLSRDEYITVAGTPDDPRRAYAEDMLEASGIAEVFDGIHDIEIDEPEEDFPILRMAFASWISTVRFHIPEYGRWLATNSSRNVYAHHRRTLQHFTWQRRQREPGRRGQWLLKMPFHLMELESLLETYPDALFIQTHREPTQFMGSWNSLVERLRSISSEPVPSHEFGAEQLAFMSGMLDKAVDFRLAHPELEDRWIDVDYFELVEDPFSVIRRIYEHFGWTLEQAAADAMEDWQFRQVEKRSAEKRHRYALEDYGLTPDAVNAAFVRYRDFITRQGIRSLRK